VTRIVERELVPEARRRWARRLDEMAFVFDATGRPEPAAIARASAAALADETRDVVRQPLATGLARRALEIAGEVAAGRLRAAARGRQPAAGGRQPVDVSRKPVDVSRKPVDVSRKPVDVSRKP